MNPIASKFHHTIKKSIYKMTTIRNLKWLKMVFDFCMVTYLIVIQRSEILNVDSNSNQWNRNKINLKKRLAGLISVNCRLACKILSWMKCEMKLKVLWNEIKLKWSVKKINPIEYTIIFLLVIFLLNVIILFSATRRICESGGIIISAFHQYGWW